ncbi:protein moonraker [Bombina bombina]|uniref:protein moonraker n=1 Tax=Bombina bombina TaxID=8345 RepID=UPI00235AAAEE|nr:protein moonraker [Bombina bombina]
MAMDILNYPRTMQSGLTNMSGTQYLPLSGSHQIKDVQLKFNRDVTTHPANLAARFSNPSPIIIEKLHTSHQQQEENLPDQVSLKNSSSSVLFSAVSAERLNLAVQLAKRDVKRNHIVEKQTRSSLGNSSPSKKELKHMPEKVKSLQRPHKESRKAKNASALEVTRSGALVYVYTPEKVQMHPVMSDSPPTHDPGPGRTKVDELEHEVKRLQIELHTYMQKIEELARREHNGEVLDPNEAARGRVRQKERATRSARMLYTLQQQVKEIQEDLEHLSPQKIKHTKKSQTMSRLAAIHRGAIRALQMFVSQLNERSDLQIPALYKELGHLIRQLSLCTAKVETGSDPVTSNLIISILQQVEDLDTLLESKMATRIRKPASRSPISRDCALQAGSPRRETKVAVPVFKQREPSGDKWKGVRKSLDFDKPQDRLTASTQTDHRPPDDPPTPERRAALKSGLEALIQAGGLKDLARRDVGQGQYRSKGVLLPQRPQYYVLKLFPPRVEMGVNIVLMSPPVLTNVLNVMKYQDIVRQRFTQIAYADPEFWAQEEKDRASAVIDQRPRSPHPIRITKSADQRDPIVDILLEEPQEGDSFQISKEEMAIGSPRPFPLAKPVPNEQQICISVPTNMLRSIHKYKDQFDRHLRLTSHEEVGSFNPWNILESLAEEIMEETLEDVAMELQEACESYAEAIFTSEFLEPNETNSNINN